MNILVWLVRIAVGGTFVFSGFVKAIDPWGTVFKLEEYLGVMDIALPHEMIVTAAFVLAATEFTVGVMLALGCLRRSIVWVTAIIMVGMTALTAWIYATDPVADCGCFGDALIISNGATLIKNIVLCILTVILLKYNRRVRGLITPRIQWFAIVFSVLYTAAIGLYGYTVQPLIDFRPYAVGNTLADTDVPEPRFIYTLNGETRSFSPDSLPDDPWEFVAREEPASVSDHLALIDSDGEDVTSELAEDSDNGLLILAVSNPEIHGISRSQMANALNRYALEHDATMIAAVATDTPEEWATSVSAEYPVYTADDTDLKTLVRGNAALVYVSDDTIRWKYVIYDMAPDITESPEAKSVNILKEIKPVEDCGILTNITVPYLLVMGCLVILSAVSVTGRFLWKRKKRAETPINK